MTSRGNIFEAPANSAAEETLIPLLERSGFRLEKIVSYGQASEPGFWYDQENEEWVLLVRGEAVLEFEHERIELTSGDYLLIPAHAKHRVAYCSQDAVWLAVHTYQSSAG